MFMGGPCVGIVSPLLSCPLLSGVWQQRETYFSEWAVGIICFAAAAAVQSRIYWIPPLSKVFSSFPLLSFSPPHRSRSLKERRPEGLLKIKLLGKCDWGQRTQEEEREVERLFVSA